jgi:PAS domain S-box-containing protein
MTLPRLDRALLARFLSLALILAGAILPRWIPSIDPLRDVLLVAAVGIAAYADGWVGGFVAAGIALFVLQTLPQEIEHRRELAQWVEWLVVVAVMATARRQFIHYRQGEAKLKSLVASMDDLFFIIDENGVYLEHVATQRPLQVLTEGGIVGRRIDELMPGQQSERLLAGIRQALAKRRSVIVDYAVPIAGRETWYAAHISPLTGSSVICVARDITWRKNTEVALQQSNVDLEQKVRERTRELSLSEERFRLMARATSDALWDLDLVTGKLWRSEGYEMLFGYQTGELSPDRDAWLDLLHPADRGRVRQSYYQALETGEPTWSAEYRFRRADGTYATVADHACIVRGEKLEPLRILGAMMDITHRKQLEEQLEQAKRVTSLGRIAASIAHEFNNVLMGILPNAEVLKRKVGPELHPITENVFRSVRRGKKVTDEILRYTRPADLKLASIEVRSFFDRWREEITPQLGPSVKLVVDIEGDDMHILADSRQVAQVFTNLALNGRDAMQEKGGGTFTLRAEAGKSFGSFHLGVLNTADRFIHFTVMDEGSGIAPERMPHMFEPLFTTKKDGVGLGLASAYQIVTRHEGQIFVESEVGIGTTFHLFLPLALPALEAVPEQNAPRALSIHRVLLVEDEVAVASGISGLLELDGLEVRTVVTGREAVPAIEAFTPDVVVLDIGLPDMSGVDVYHNIDARWPQLPVVFSSGHGDASRLRNYLEKPHVSFLLKPYEYDTIKRVLSEIVA